MSYDKEYPNRKDWRKRYNRAGKYCRSCRPHGSCSWCRNNRLHSTKLREQSAESKEKE